MNFDGTAAVSLGTSFSAPYMAGMFAVGCQIAGALCTTAANPNEVYNALRNIGVLGTVVNLNGGALPAGTTSRFINRAPW